MDDGRVCSAELAMIIDCCEMSLDLTERLGLGREVTVFFVTVGRPALFAIGTSLEAHDMDKKDDSPVMER